MGFIDLTAINTYKKRKKNRLLYKLTEITVVKKHDWKNTFNSFTFFVSKSVHLLENLWRQHRTSDLKFIVLH